MTHMVGFNGIVAFIKADVAKTINVKLVDGRELLVIMDAFVSG